MWLISSILLIYTGSLASNLGPYLREYQMPGPFCKAYSEVETVLKQEINWAYVETHPYY